MAKMQSSTSLKMQQLPFIGQIYLVGRLALKPPRHPKDANISGSTYRYSQKWMMLRIIKAA